MNHLINKCQNKMILDNNNIILTLLASDLINIFNNKSNLIFEDLTGDIQRNIDIDHLNNLIKYQESYYDKYGHFSYPNPLTLCEYNNKISLLDGQHRYGSLERLCRLYKRDFNIIVSIIKLNNMDEYDDYYYAINMNKPVTLYNNKESWKNVGKKIEKYIRDKWNAYIKTTSNPQMPNFNIDKFNQYLDKHDIIKKTGITYEIFIKEMDDLNIFYKINWKKYVKPHIKNTVYYVDKIESKLCSNKCYLGLYKNFEWVDCIIYKYKNNINYENMEHCINNKRIKIPKKLRNKLWKIYFDKLDGKCYVCQDNIDYDNFECGHIKSVFFGGKTILENLRPVCRTCNNEVGISDMDEFKIKYENIAADKNIIS